MIFSLSSQYLLGMAVWLAGMAVAFAVLLRFRRKFRKSKAVVLIHVVLSFWMLLAAVTACELVFALFIDHSDSFNMTNVSKRWFDRHIEKQRNSFGARDREEFPKRVPEGTCRIGFVGDSFTVGHGIDNMDDRFSDRVAASLERKYPGRFVVANLGDPGLEISMIEARVEGVLTQDYDVDMFIYVVCLNDIEGYDPKMQQSNQNLQQLAPKSRLIAGTYFLNWLYFRFVQFNRPEVRDYYPNLHDSYHSPAWDGFRRHLDEMKKHCAAKGAELRVVIFPFVSSLGPEYPFRDVHAKIADYCRASEIRVLDLEPVLSQHADVDLTVSRYDAHPNERAHEIAADAIFEKLLDDVDQFCTESSPPDKER